MGVIPARFDSIRLPGKVLRQIKGKPMVQWVYEAAAASDQLEDLVVATDSKRVRLVCDRLGIPTVLTGRQASGSDRVYEVLTKTDADVYVNIQGDEPTLRPSHFDLLLSPFTAGTAEVSTLKVKITAEEALDPNTVKVVTDLKGRALYFSRRPIPFDRAGSEKAPFFKHIGLYAYSREALSQYHSLSRSVLEITERLEQLRFLENGISIYVIETPHDTIGVDTEEDLEKVAGLLE
jgi:3-deoxy-manno-octulosonate cytidylyltransferase (CMP-KDO synthetase)